MASHSMRRSALTEPGRRPQSNYIDRLPSGNVRSLHEGDTMIRLRALQVILVLVGLLFTAAIYPVATSLWHFSPSDDHGDTMMLSLYFTLGLFLLAAVPRPQAYRSAIAFAAWSSFAHGFTMTVMGFHMPLEK